MQNREIREEILRTTELFLLDLDGTVYLGGNPIGDMVRTLYALRKMGKKIAFVTNASLKTEKEYTAYLRERELWADGDYIFTSATAGLRYLKKQCAGKKVHILATEAMQTRFREAGVILDETDPDVCLLSYDTSLDFAKLKAFGESLQKGALYIATHNDLVCPTETLPQPDVGAFIAFFKACTGRTPTVICGKPGEILVDEIERRTGMQRDTMCMVGDRLYTDIRFGNRNGIRTLLVLTGEAKTDDLESSTDKPDWVLPSLNDLV